MSQKKPKYFPLTELIGELKNNGFNIGIDTYLHLYQILDRIDFEIDNEKNTDSLCQYLCPLFASSDKQQQKFYEIYDRLIKDLDPNLFESNGEAIDQIQVPPKPESIIIKPVKLKNLWSFYLSACLGIVIVFFIGYKFYPENNEPLQELAAPVPGKNILPNLSIEQFLVFVLSLLIIILLFYILFRIYQYLLRRLLATGKYGPKPPYIWNIRSKNNRIALDPKTNMVANLMRFKIPGSTLKLNLKKTIDYTCKNPGIQTLQYSENTKTVGFLMLIDWPDMRNHQVQLFDYLYRTFVENNVYIERYYYDSDPRICWNGINNDGIRLDYLQQLFPDAYLLLFGSGKGFINRFDNTLYQFASVFEKWENRALLTPLPSAHWGVQEMILHNLFSIILPATIDGLMELTEYFNGKSVETSDLKDWKFDKNKRESYIYLTSENIKNHPDILWPLNVWVAACAVYPELYWDLTIAIGKKLEDSGLKNLVTQNNLAILARIDWFRTGIIPRKERDLLLENKELLPDKDKDIAITTVIDVLEQNLKDLPNSQAKDRIVMNIVVSKQMLTTTSPEELAQLQKIEEKLRQNADGKYFVEIGYDKKSFWDFLLPAKFKKIPYKLNIPEENVNVEPEMVFVKGGGFIMGDDNSTLKNEKPSHKVVLSDFYISKYLVTQKLWVDIMGSNPSNNKGGFNYPVENVSWNNVQEFINKLNVKAGKNYRLPTEAEWEYAAGGGLNNRTKWAGTNNMYELDSYAWYSNNCNGETNPVGTRKSNSLGIYDMSGNVMEWCNDQYDLNYYELCKQSIFTSNPTGAKNSMERVLRGGTWLGDESHCRIAYRRHDAPDTKWSIYGFRLSHSYPISINPRISKN